MNHVESHTRFEAATMVGGGFDRALLPSEHHEAAITVVEMPHETNMVVNKSVVHPIVFDRDDQTNLSITVEAGAKIRLVFSNRIDKQHVHVHLEANAVAELFYTPREPNQPCDHSLAATVDENAFLTIFEVTDGAAQVRREMTIDLAGKFASISYFGLDQMHSSTKSTLLTILHRAEHTKSSQAFRGIYAGNAQATFLGKVVVDDNASQSSATQLYKSILLSDHAKAFVMPQLEINNSDIKASHGASIGELDKGALFYLQSRGISLSTAKAMLLSGIITDILDHIEEPSIKHALVTKIEKSLEHSLLGDA